MSRIKDCYSVGLETLLFDIWPHFRGTRCCHFMFYTENGGSVFPRKIGAYLQKYQKAVLFIVTAIKA
jgi:hypothetical protein